MELKLQYQLGFIFAGFLASLSIYIIVRGLSVVIGTVFAALAMAILTVITIDAGFDFREWGRANPNRIGPPLNMKAIVYAAFLGNGIIAFAVISIARGGSIEEASGFTGMVILFMFNLLSVVIGYIWSIEYRNAKTEDERTNAKDTLFILPALVIPLTIITVLAFAGILTGNTIKESITQAMCIGFITIGIIFLVYILLLSLRPKSKKKNGTATSFSAVEIDDNIEQLVMDDQPSVDEKKRI
jgi:hypothetical protein